MPPSSPSRRRKFCGILSSHQLHLTVKETTVSCRFDSQEPPIFREVRVLVVLRGGRSVGKPNLCDLHVHLLCPSLYIKQGLIRASPMCFKSILCISDHVLAKVLRMSQQIYEHRKPTHKHPADLLLCVLLPLHSCLLYTSPSPRDRTRSRMPSSA